jgi:hypothetical protein
MPSTSESSPASKGPRQSIAKYMYQHTFRYWWPFKFDLQDVQTLPVLLTVVPARLQATGYRQEGLIFSV